MPVMLSDSCCAVQCSAAARRAWPAIFCGPEPMCKSVLAGWHFFCFSHIRSRHCLEPVSLQPSSMSPSAVTGTWFRGWVAQMLLGLASGQAWWPCRHGIIHQWVAVPGCALYDFVCCHCISARHLLFNTHKPMSAQAVSFLVVCPNQALAEEQACRDQQRLHAAARPLVANLMGGVMPALMAGLVKVALNRPADPCQVKLLLPKPLLLLVQQLAAAPEKVHTFPWHPACLIATTCAIALHPQMSWPSA